MFFLCFFMFFYAFTKQNWYFRCKPLNSLRKSLIFAVFLLLAGWLAGWLVGWHAGWLAGWREKREVTSDCMRSFLDFGRSCQKGCSMSKSILWGECVSERATWCAIRNVQTKMQKSCVVERWAPCLRFVVIDDANTKATQMNCACAHLSQTEILGFCTPDLLGTPNFHDRPQPPEPWRF